MDKIERFKRSYAVLQRFYEEWLERIQERCAEPEQRHAAFYVWARYSMSMRTLDALSDPRLFPDVAVICRGCIEFDVSLEAVIKDAAMARDYLEFERHAKAHYLRILREQGDIERVLLRTGQFEERFDERPEGFKDTSWCKKRGGITGLMRWFGRPYHLRIYNILSHFAHGSFEAMQMLERCRDDPKIRFAALVDNTYNMYLESSRAFVCFAWEPLITPEGERCKQDFVGVMSAHVEGAG